MEVKLDTTPVDAGDVATPPVGGSMVQTWVVGVPAILVVIVVT